MNWKVGLLTGYIGIQYTTNTNIGSKVCKYYPQGAILICRVWIAPLGITVLSTYTFLSCFLGASLAFTRKVQMPIQIETRNC